MKRAPSFSPFGLVALGGLLVATPACRKPAPAAAKNAPSNATSPTRAASATSPTRNVAGPCPHGDVASDEFDLLSWHEAYEYVRDQSSAWPDRPDPTDDAEARRALCVKSSGDAALPPAPSDHCAGNYFVVTTSHLQYSDLTFVLVPRGDHVFVFEAGMVGGGACSGAQNSSTVSLEIVERPTELELRLEETSYEWNESASADETCREDARSTTRYVFDPRTGVACRANTE